jgi:valyl-tRNA synthetase
VKKLSNTGFTGKAPAEVVAKERERADELTLGIRNLRSQQEKIQKL